MLTPGQLAELLTRAELQQLLEHLSKSLGGTDHELRLRFGGVTISDARSALAVLSRDRLKELCRSRSVPDYGREKSTLIARLLGSESPAEGSEQGLSKETSAVAAPGVGGTPDAPQEALSKSDRGTTEKRVSAGAGVDGPVQPNKPAAVGTQTESEPIALEGSLGPARVAAKLPFKVGISLFVLGTVLTAGYYAGALRRDVEYNDCRDKLTKCSNTGTTETKPTGEAATAPPAAKSQHVVTTSPTRGPDWSTQLASCAQEAAALGRPYVIASALMTINVEDTKKSRSYEYRTVYSVLALRPISAGETIFREDYDQRNSFAALRIPGSEREIDHFSQAAGIGYDVLFQAEKGGIRTIETAAEFQKHLPLEGGRTAFGGSLNLTQNQDEATYLNRDDVLCETIVLVKSKSLKLRPVGQGAKRLTDRQISQGDAQTGDSERISTIGAKWQLVRPNEEVGIHYSWQ